MSQLPTVVGASHDKERDRCCVVSHLKPRAALALRRLKLAVILIALVTTVVEGQTARDSVVVRKVTDSLFVLSNASANLLVRAGDTESLIAGPQRPDLIRAARALLRSLRAAPVRYVVVTDDDTAPNDAEGGWRASGAFVFAQENLLGRIASYQYSAEQSRGDKSNDWRHRVPTVGFSDVVQLICQSEDVHVVHQLPGYKNSDVIVHFEGSHVLYLGNSYTSDGYPEIDVTQGGSINGLIATIKSFVQGFPESQIFVPGRGSVTTGRELRNYLEMLTAVRDTVERLRDGGKSAPATISARPTQRFDPIWNRGPVSADRFVAAVFATLPKR